MDSFSELVSDSQILSMLDESAKTLLRTAAVEQLYNVGEIVTHEGDHGDEFFMIMSGRVQVSAEGLDGRVELARLGPGTIFGEIAALTGEPRIATITATETAKILCVDISRAKDILERHPKVLQLLNQMGLTRAEETMQKMLDG